MGAPSGDLHPQERLLIGYCSRHTPWQVRREDVDKGRTSAAARRRVSVTNALSNVSKWKSNAMGSSSHLFATRGCRPPSLMGPAMTVRAILTPFRRSPADTGSRPRQGRYRASRRDTVSRKASNTPPHLVILRGLKGSWKSSVKAPSRSRRSSRRDARGQAKRRQTTPRAKGRRGRSPGRRAAAEAKVM
jgi:hypothetical protein